MKTVIIYKDYVFGRLELFVGVLVSKNKTYKIENIKSGHFAGYKTLIKPEDVIAEINTEDEKIAKILDMIKDCYNDQYRVSEDIRLLEKDRKEVAIKTIEKIQNYIK